VVYILKLLGRLSFSVRLSSKIKLPSSKIKLRKALSSGVYWIWSWPRARVTTAASRLQNSQPASAPATVFLSHMLVFTALLILSHSSSLASSLWLLCLRQALQRSFVSVMSCWGCWDIIRLETLGNQARENACALWTVVRQRFVQYSGAYTRPPRILRRPCSKDSWDVVWLVLPGARR
jgi:hypothetical protein